MKRTVHIVRWQAGSHCVPVRQSPSQRKVQIILGGCRTMRRELPNEGAGETPNPVHQTQSA